MKKIIILCLEDEPEVRHAIVRDLEPFEKDFVIENAEDASEAQQVIDEHEKAGNLIGLLLCDHVLPGTNGVDFLVSLNKQEKHRFMRKVLFTGQAGQQETITAINEARIHYYIPKPWNSERLHQVVRNELTEFVLETVDDLYPYVSVLDSTRLLEAIRLRKTDE